MEKGATAAPFFIAGEVGLAFLAGLLLPALGFLCHCLLSPPSSGLLARTLAGSCLWLPPGTLTETGALRFAALSVSCTLAQPELDSEE